MERRSPVAIALTVLAYMIATFAMQGTSHFVINADHFASISIMRAEPMVPMGLLAMAVQGLIFALLFPIFNRGPNPLFNGPSSSPGRSERFSLHTSCSAKQANTRSRRSARGSRWN